MNAATNKGPRPLHIRSSGRGPFYIHEQTEENCNSERVCQSGERLFSELAADGCETILEVGEDVVNVLGADGQADGVLIDALVGQL